MNQNNIVRMIDDARKFEADNMTVFVPKRYRDKTYKSIVFEEIPFTDQYQTVFDGKVKKNSKIHKNIISNMLWNRKIELITD